MVRTRHRIGGYRVIAPIGAGGSATVYRALDESTGREVAIKVLAENHSLIAERRRRFVEEVELLATVESPAIAKIFEVGETETSQPYMVLELADRGDLRRRVEEIRTNRQVLNRADLNMLAYHLYEALSTLHQADIVHRDVSPGNILIRTRRQGAANRGNVGVTLLEPGERFLLADLGHAKDMEMASGLTAGGGTRGFAAPEQRDDITMVDHRADIFSATAIMEWASHDGRYADDLEPFFDKGLAAEPDDRFDSMDEWHEAFCAALGARAEPPRPHRLQRLALGAAAGLLVGGLVALVVTQRTTSTDQVEARAGVGEAAIGDASGSPDVEVRSEISQRAGGDDEFNPLQVSASGGDEQRDGANDLATASFEVPEDGATLTGDLVIEGTAEGQAEGEMVELAIRNTLTGTYWNPKTSKFQPGVHRFPIGVSQLDEAEVMSWRYTVSSGFLEPADYELSVWARGESAGDVASDVRNVTVTG